jgi:hypothetical protein
MLLAMAAAPAAADQPAADPCVPAAAQAGEKAKGFGRLGAIGSRLAGRLGIPGARDKAADIAAIGAAGADAAAVAGELIDCTAQVQPVAAAANRVPSDAAPPAAPPRRFSLPQFGADGRRDCGALGAGCADGLNAVVACKSQKSFWSEMANFVEGKRASAAPDDLAAMDADIATMRAAHAAKTSKLQPTDGSSPDRYLGWFSSDEEQSAVNTQIAQTINAHRRQCDAAVRF